MCARWDDSAMVWEGEAGEGLKPGQGWKWAAERRARGKWGLGLAPELQPFTFHALSSQGPGLLGSTLAPLCARVGGQRP